MQTCNVFYQWCPKKYFEEGEPIHTKNNKNKYNNNCICIIDILQLIVCRWLFDDSWSLIASNFKFLVPITIWLRFLWAIHTAVTAVHFVCTAVINQPLTNLAVVANCPLRIKLSSFTFLWLILIFLLVVRFSWPLYPSNVPPHFELKSMKWRT